SWPRHTQLAFISYSGLPSVMGAVAGTRPQQVQDVHGVEPVIAARIDFLRSSRKLRGERPISREARDAVLAFCRARKGEVSSTRFRTYLSRLPQVAARLGQDFLAPSRETTARFKEAFPDDRYKASSREGSWYVLRVFWTWWFDQKGEPLPYYLKIRFPKNGEARIGPTAVLTRDDVAKIAAATTSLRDRAWVWS